MHITSIPSGKLLVAVSGGVDSCVLLHVFAQEKPKEELVVVHVNHNWRGKESDEDEQFVIDLAEKYGVVCESCKLIPAPKSEEEAREMRYAFFKKMLKKHKADFVALAQHKNDQVETLLLQLIRGTTSFSPMQEFSGTKWRPFLEISKDEILSFARKNTISWREDSSNNNEKFLRNKIRNTLLPLLNGINGNFENLFLRFASDVSEIFLERKKEAENFLQSKKNFSQLEFLSFPKSLQKALIKEMNPELYSKHIEEVIEMVKKGEGKKEKHGFSLNKKMLSFGKTQNNLIQSQIILASQSPQRKRLLEGMGYDFLVLPSSYNEIWDNKKTIEENILMFAEEKAKAVWKDHKNSIVIGCDTFVVHPKNGVYLKPKNKEEAKKMLASYSGSTVLVLSGISVFHKNKKETQLVSTSIEFSHISESEIQEWLERNEWQERSGACSIEGFAMRYTKKIDGCFFNIVGLPTQVLQKMLLSFLTSDN